MDRYRPPSSNSQSGSGQAPSQAQAQQRLYNPSPYSDSSSSYQAAGIGMWDSPAQGLGQGYGQQQNPNGYLGRPQQQPNGSSPGSSFGTGHGLGSMPMSAPGQGTNGSSSASSLLSSSVPTTASLLGSASTSASASGVGPGGVKVQPLLCSGHTRPVTYVQFSNQLSDGTYLLISGCKDGNPMLRNWLGDWIGTFLGHKGAVYSAKLSHDTSLALTASADYTAKLWATESGECLRTIQHKHIVRTVALEPEARPSKVLTGGKEKKIRLVDLEREDAEPDILGAGVEEESTGGSKGEIQSLVWDEGAGVGGGGGGGGGGVVCSAADDGIVRWWDIRSQKQTASLDLGEPITSMELAHGGGTLSVTAGKKVHFLDLLRQHPPVSIPLPHPSPSASLHPFLRDRFASGSTNDGWIRIYDLDSGSEREVYKGHHGPVWSVAYSPDGEVYATGSEDGTIRLWQTNPGRSYGLWQAADGL